MLVRALNAVILLLSLFTLTSLASAIQTANNVTILSNSTNLGYSGNGWSHIQGVTCGEDGQWATSNVAGDNISLRFVGAIGLTLFGSSSVDSAKIHIQIDNVTSDLDLSAVAGASNQCFPIFSISNLDQSTTHNLTAFHSGPGENTRNGNGIFAISHIIVHQTGSQTDITTTGTPNISATPTRPTLPTLQASISSAPTASLPASPVHGDSKGGLITGVIFGSIFSLLIIIGGLFIARRQGYLCWRQTDRRISLSKGISSDGFFTGGISHKDFSGAISNTTQPSFDKCPPFNESFKRDAGEKVLNISSSKSHNDQVAAALATPKVYSPSPAVIVEDYDSLRGAQTVPNDSDKSTKEAGPSRLSLAPDSSSNRRPSRFLSKFSPNNSPTSFNFKLNIGKNSQEESIRSGRASPVSIANSWRTEDVRYSGITVKMATREILRAEQPQLSLAWKQAGPLEKGTGDK